MIAGSCQRRQQCFNRMVLRMGDCCVVHPLLPLLASRVPSPSASHGRYLPVQPTYIAFARMALFPVLRALDSSSACRTVRRLRLAAVLLTPMQQVCSNDES
jgi:hypothetical protein